jgi:16S rRNA (adenine1518-N6/adenine1519-N6)-dimethyltransferase
MSFDLTDVHLLKSLLSRFRIRPADRMGQNFLVDREALTAIVAAADLRAEDTVLEIGPGLGTLTMELAARCQRVVAVEKDRKLIKPLNFILKKFSNVEIINDDILKFNLEEAISYKLSAKTYKVVANIPYNITGEILRFLLTLPLRPELIVLLVQKEVGERVVAGPGKQSVLGLSVQYFGQPEILGKVSAAAFWPSPKVDSAILKITPYVRPKLNVSEKDFFRLIKIGFASRRKTLLNNLCAGLRLTKDKCAEILELAEINPQARAQELNMEEWEKLYKRIEI